MPPKKAQESTDIYKGEKQAIIEGLGKIGYDKETVDKRLQALQKIEGEKIHKEINYKLDSLAVKAGSKEHIDFLDSLLKRSQNPLDTVRQKVSETKEELTDAVDKTKEQIVKKAKDGFMAKFGIDKMITKFNSMFEKVSTQFSGFWNKILLAIGGALGIKLGVENTGDNNALEEDEPEEETNTPKENKQTSTGGENNEITPKIKQSPETEKSILYKAGIKTMLSLTGIKQNNNTDNDGILEEISQQKYNTIKELSDSQKTQFLGGNEIKTFNTIIEQLKDKKFVDIANYNFKGDFIKNIILDDNDNINEKLVNKITGGKERLQEILEYPKSDSLWWQEKLSIAEIALFYTHSFGFLNIPSTGFESKAFMGGLLFNKTEFEEIKNNNIVPEKILTNFVKKYKTDFGAKDLVNNDEAVRIDIGEGLNQHEKEKLERLIEFKEYLLNDYLNIFKPKIEGGNIALFKDHLNYKTVIALYSIMGGKKELPTEMNAINKISIAYVNSKIIGGFAGSAYLGNIFYDIITDEHTIFTDEEMGVLGIYKDKAYDIVIGSKLNEIGEKLGFARGLTNTNLNSIAIKMGSGGAISYYIGGKLIKRGIEKKGISIIGMFTKKLGLLGILGGMAVGGYSFYNKEHVKHSLGKDLEKAGDDSNKILEILETYKNAISPIEGTSLKIIKYQNDTPLIIMEGKIYTFDIIDAPLLDKVKNTDYGDPNGWKSLGENGLKLLLDFLPDSNKTKVNGQIIERDDIKVIGDKISFGEKGKSIEYSLSELFQGISNKEMQIDKSTLKKIRLWADENGKDASFLGGEDVQFIKLKGLNDGKIISLVQIGDTEQQKNGN